MHPELLLRLAADRHRDDFKRAERARLRAAIQAHPSAIRRAPAWSRPPARQVRSVPASVVVDQPARPGSAPSQGPETPAA